MIKKHSVWILMIAALAMLASACETIPDDDGAKVSIQINALAKPGELPIGVDPAAMISFRLHVKITLTNPDETFYAFDWDGYEPIGLMVAATGRRVIDVEVYEVDLVSGSTNYFPGSHYLTLDPPEYRTVDLTGDDAQMVNITIYPDSDLGGIGGGKQVEISDGNTFVPLDFFRSCPPPSDFYANVVDLDWGGFRMFPPIPVDLSSGLYLNPFPAGHNMAVEVYHETAKVSGRANGLIPSGIDLPLDVKLGGYRAPRLEFATDPTFLYPNSLTYGYVGNIFWRIVGGWGGMESSSWPYTTSKDTCYGPEQSSPDPYGYIIPPPSSIGSCRVEISNMADCRGTSVPTAGADIPIRTACGNGICDDFLGETSTSCSKDCAPVTPVRIR